MATRITTAQRRRSLLDSLRLAVRDGALPAGSMLPTVRELAQKHQLSVFAVSKEIQTLIDDGVLYTTPRVGTFVGQSMEQISRCFLLVTSSYPFVPFIKMGFEDRIAQLGASSVVLPLEEALERLHHGQLPEISGVFDFATNERTQAAWPVSASIPLVRFADMGRFDVADPEGKADRVYFDELGGGRQAVEFLRRLGHTRIAYLGLHMAQEATYYHWSAKRMQGWHDAMQRTGSDTGDLFFLPKSEPQSEDHEAIVAALGAAALVSRRDITAVVGANDNAIQGLIEALQTAHIPEADWPAMVGFDNHAKVSRYVVTSLRLPWEEVGRAAAELLWARWAGRTNGATQFVSIPMRIIARPMAHRHAVVDRSNTQLVAL